MMMIIRARRPRLPPTVPPTIAPTCSLLEGAPRKAAQLGPSQLVVDIGGRVDDKVGVAVEDEVIDWDGLDVTLVGVEIHHQLWLRNLSMSLTQGSSYLVQSS